MVPEDVKLNLKEKTTFAGSKIDEMRQASKERIKELRDWAKENLLDKEVYHKEIGANINFTNNGVKEFLNQPHRDYYAKNELLKTIDAIIPKSKLVDNLPDGNNNPNHHYYYLETKTGNYPSYIVIRLTRHNNQYALYSMVDKLKNR